MLISVTSPSSSKNVAKIVTEVHVQALRRLLEDVHPLREDPPHEDRLPRSVIEKAIGTVDAIESRVGTVRETASESEIKIGIEGKISMRIVIGTMTEITVVMKMFAIRVGIETDAEIVRGRESTQIGHTGIGIGDNLLLSSVL